MLSALTCILQTIVDRKHLAATSLQLVLVDCSTAQNSQTVANASMSEPNVGHLDKLHSAATPVVQARHVHHAKGP